MNLFPSISPRLGLQTLAKMMPERVGHPVEKFDMYLFAKEKRIDFVVYLPDGVAFTPELKKYMNPDRSHRYKFEGAEKICDIVHKIIKAKLPDNYELDVAKISYDEKSEEITAESFGVKDGEKLKQTFKL